MSISNKHLVSSFLFLHHYQPPNWSYGDKAKLIHFQSASIKWLVHRAIRSSAIFCFQLYLSRFLSFLAKFLTPSKIQLTVLSFIIIWLSVLPFAHQSLNPCLLTRIRERTSQACLSFVLFAEWIIKDRKCCLIILVLTKTNGSVVLPDCADKERQESALKVWLILMNSVNASYVSSCSPRMWRGVLLSAKKSNLEKKALLSPHPPP